MQEIALAGLYRGGFFFFFRQSGDIEADTMV